jgi:two-component system, OmpR family, sensor kinase
MIRSLRARLFVGLTTIIILFGGAGAYFGYRWAYGEAIEMQDSVLSQVGTFVMNTARRESQPVHGVDADSEIAVIELGTSPLGSEDDRRLWSLGDGLHNDIRQSEPVRVLLRTRPDSSRFAVTQRAEIRDDIAGDTAVRTLLPIAALVPCLMLIIAVVIAGSFRSMVRLAGDLDTGRVEEIHSLPLAGAPLELHPFLNSINGLLARIHGMMERQRRFIADAAHELRTPITALSLQAENLEALAMTPAAHERAAVLTDGARRIKRLLEQLLELARQDVGPPLNVQTVSLDTIAKELSADLVAEAWAKDIDLGFERIEKASAPGEAFMITSAIRNIMENAIKFTPRGGRVDLSTYREDNLAVISVEDTGPGIPAADLVRIFEPFVRGRNPTSSGSGLGLSIVKRVVENHGGVVVLENVTRIDRSGLRVAIKLPLKKPARGSEDEPNLS